jgi:hypothetical protein
MKTQTLFDFGITGALESYGTWGVYLRYCGRVRFDLYPDHAFSRHYQTKVMRRAAIAPGQPTDRRSVVPAPCAAFACYGEATATIQTVEGARRVCDRHGLEAQGAEFTVTWDAWA